MQNYFSFVLCDSKIYLRTLLAHQRVQGVFVVTGSIAL